MNKDLLTVCTELAETIHVLHRVSSPVEQVLITLAASATPLAMMPDNMWKDMLKVASQPNKSEEAPDIIMLFTVMDRLRSSRRIILKEKGIIK